MRAAAALFLLLLAAPPAAAAPDAQSAYVQRRGLLQLDGQCRLLTPGARAALQATGMQARNALLRSGWSDLQVQDLERAAINAARTRTCDDARTLQAAAAARAAFAAWTRASSMSFPGALRTWTARRFPDINGMRLDQTLDAGVHFGVRDRNGAETLALLLPLSTGQAPPSSAALVLHDRPGARAVSFAAAAQHIEAADRFRPQMLVFDFPPDAFASLAALDPREPVNVQLTTSASSRRMLVEVGDLAAARAFLAARPD